jgi:hypothetical protein
VAFSKRYRYSYSGADVKCWAYFPHWAAGYPIQENWQVDPQSIGQQPAPAPIELEALHTISVSIHEPRGPARSLGFRNVKGFARSVRTIAGSIIMTIIEDHPLLTMMRKDREYAEYHMKASGRDRRMWSADLDMFGVGSMFSANDLSVRLPTMLAPFNLFSRYVSESGVSVADDLVTVDTLVGKGSGFQQNAGIAHGGWLLSGVELVGEGVTTSVNDMVTEVMYQFVARDYKSFTTSEAVVSGNITNFLYDLDTPVTVEESLHATLMEALALQEEQSWAQQSVYATPPVEEGLPSREQKYIPTTSRGVGMM